MGSLSPTAMRRAGRIGVPIVAALAAVLVSTQGASAATARPHPPVPPSCLQQMPVPGTPIPGTPQIKISQNGSGSGGVVVTKPGPGNPGMITCVVCGSQTQPDGTVIHKPGVCVVCIATIKPGREHGGSGSVSVHAGGSGQVTGGSGKVIVDKGKGGGEVTCPPIQLPVDPPIHR